MRRAVSLSLALLILAALPGTAQEVRYRELSFDVREVTRPDVAAFPDGGVLFTLLGHLYRVPAEGGEAVQLTRGVFFHKEPAVSPDGATIAVVSDRDAEVRDNVWLLDADGGNARVLTDEVEAGRPAWSPDGTRLAYLAFPSPRPKEDFFATPPAQVREVDLASGSVRDVTEGFQDIRDVTYGPGGELLWLHFRGDGTCRACGETDVYQETPDGAAEVVATLKDRVQQIRVTEAGVLYWSVRGDFWSEDTTPERRKLYTGPSLEGPWNAILHADIRVTGTVAPRFAAVPGAELRAYLGDWGQLREVRAEERRWRRIPFQARVRQTVMESAGPPPWTPPEDMESFPVTAVGNPILRPDGQELAFTAAGTVWYRRAGDAEDPPRRISEDWAGAPAYAPVGGKVSYVRTFLESPGSPMELMVADGWEGTPNPVAEVGFYAINGFGPPQWSPDGTKLVSTKDIAPFEVTVPGGSPEPLELDVGPVVALQIMEDGTTLTAYQGMDRDLISIPLDAPETAVPLTDIQEQMKPPRASPDGRWLAFRRNGDLHVADMAAALADDGVVTEDEVTIRIDGGGLGFSFDPRGDAVIYTRGSRIFRKALPDGEEEEISGPFTLPGAERGSTIIRNVRVLGPSGTGFTEAQDLFIQGGRITGIGRAPRGFDLQSATEVDAGGRFAVPGLWEAHRHGATNATLRHGVTSYRDAGAPMMNVVEDVDHERAFGASLPRRFSAGEIFEGLESHFGENFSRVGTADDARRFVRQWKGLGVRFIKVYRSLPWSLHRVVAEEATLQGLPVMGHGMFPEELVRSVTLGYRYIEHVGFPQFFHDDVLSLMAEAGVYWTPQYTERGVWGLLLHSDPEGFNRGRELLGRPPRNDEPIRPEGVAASLGAWALHAKQLRRARELGVQVLPGTDNTGGAGSIHFELELFQDAGVAPWQILRMATLEAARAEGIENDLGTLEVGKLADLLLLDTDPLEDVRNLRSPWRVLKGGQVVHAREEGP
jgi:imidazolonepropionase-like amidohydrolase